MTHRTDNLNTDARGKPRVQTVIDVELDPSRTITADASKANVNEILRKYRQVGIIEHLNQVDAQYLDVSEHTDYADMRRHVATAEAEFMGLPSKVRELFEHDVYKWLDAAHATPQELTDSGILEEAGLDTPAPSDTDNGTPTLTSETE